MTRTLLALSLMAASTLGFASEKVADTVNARVPQPSAGSFNGTLSGSWTRTLTTATASNACAASAGLSASGVGIPYAVVTIYTAASAPEVMVDDVADAGNTALDSFLSIYCDPFNAANATSNLVIADDDDGPGFLSAVLAGDNVQLSPGRQYYAVVSVFSPADVGNGAFQLNVGGNVQIGFIPQIAVDTLNTAGLALLALVVGLGGFLAVRRFS